MRNLVVLIDTNVLLNYITNREDPYLAQSVEIVRKCAVGECTGYIAFHTLSTLWYVLRKRSDSVRRQVAFLCHHLSATPRDEFSSGNFPIRYTPMTFTTYVPLRKMLSSISFKLILSILTYAHPRPHRKSSEE